MIEIREARVVFPSVLVRVGLAYLLANSPRGITPQIYGHIIPQKSILRLEDRQGLPNRKIVSIV